MPNSAKRLKESKSNRAARIQTVREDRKGTCGKGFLYGVVLELNYNQSTIVFTKVRKSFVRNEFLWCGNDQIKSAVNEGFHHSNLPWWTVQL